jgi:hypothetical protein
VTLRRDIEITPELEAAAGSVGACVSMMLWMADTSGGCVALERADVERLRQACDEALDS